MSGSNFVKLVLFSLFSTSLLSAPGVQLHSQIQEKLQLLATVDSEEDRQKIQAEILELQQEINEIPTSLKKHNLEIGNNKMSLDYKYNLKEKQTGITNLLQDIKDSGLKLRDLKTEQSNLEKIFVTLVRENNEN